MERSWVSCQGRALRAGCLGCSAGRAGGARSLPVATQLGLSVAVGRASFRSLEVRPCISRPGPSFSWAEMDKQARKHQVTQVTTEMLFIRCSRTEEKASGFCRGAGGARDLNDRQEPATQRRRWQLAWQDGARRARGGSRMVSEGCSGPTSQDL